MFGRDVYGNWGFANIFWDFVELVLPIAAVGAIVFIVWWVYLVYQVIQKYLAS